MHDEIKTNMFWTYKVLIEQYCPSFMTILKLIYVFIELELFAHNARCLILFLCESALVSILVLSKISLTVFHYWKIYNQLKFYFTIIMPAYLYSIE